MPCMLAPGPPKNVPTDKYQAGCGQSGFNLCGQKDTHHLAAIGRKASLDDLSDCRKSGESVQFILGREFVQQFDLTVDVNDGLKRINDPERKYEKKFVHKIFINQAKEPIFLNRKLRLKPNPVVVATFKLRNLNELSNHTQVCLVPNPNSKSSAILGRSFSLTQNGLCVSVLLKEAWLCFASEHRTVWRT